MPSSPSSPVQWLTANEAANHLKVQPRTLLAWTRQGQIKGYTLSGTKRRVWRYRCADLDAALTANRAVIRSCPASVPVEKKHETGKI